MSYKTFAEVIQEATGETIETLQNIDPCEWRRRIEARYKEPMKLVSCQPRYLSHAQVEKMVDEALKGRRTWKELLLGA